MGWVSVLVKIFFSFFVYVTTELPELITDLNCYANLELSRQLKAYLCFNILGCYTIIGGFCDGIGGTNS